MVSGQAEGNPAEPGHVALLWVWGQAAVSVMTALPSRMAMRWPVSDDQYERFTGGGVVVDQ